MKKKVLITGGAGYVGSFLADELIKKNYHVNVLDLFLYGSDVFESNKINLIKGDIRNINLLKKIIPGNDIIIHLACISNDPSFELNPILGKSINLEAFEPIIKISKDNGIKKFIYASSSSVYGVKKEHNVFENMKLEPLTDYSKFKAICEEICLKYRSKDFETIILRPATVCGFSRRQRFDLVVNIFTNLGFNKRQLTVFGGNQLRPNIHIKDMVQSYITSIENNDLGKVNNPIFNVGYENYSTLSLAEKVKNNIGSDLKIEIQKTNDDRSYHINSEKFSKVTKFAYKHTIDDAIKDLKRAFEHKQFQEPLSNKIYFNIKMMNSVRLK